MAVKKKVIQGVLDLGKNIKKKKSTKKTPPKVNTKSKGPKGKGPKGKGPKGKGPKVSTKGKGKGGKKKKATPTTPSFWTSLNTARKDIKHAMGIGGRAFKKSIGKKDVAKWPTKVSAHVGRHPKKYATGTIIGSGMVGKKQGTSKGRRQASHDLKI